MFENKNGGKGLLSEPQVLEKYGPLLKNDPDVYNTL